MFPWQEINLNLARDLARLAPFGPGNPEPMLMVAGGELLREMAAYRRAYQELPPDVLLSREG